MIEDFVSLEVAKHLKEEGFDEPVSVRYNKTGKLVRNSLGGLYKHNSGEIDKTYTSAPTQALVCKWLRLTRKQLVCIHLLPDAPTFPEYTFRIDFVGETKQMDYKDHKIWLIDHWHPDMTEEGNEQSWASPEEATEEAIKFCLNIKPDEQAS